jgi:hypothetical protein
MNGFTGDVKSALALDGEMIHLKARKLKICTASGDPPIQIPSFPCPCAPAAR